MSDANALPIRGDECCVAFLLACYCFGELLVNAVVLKLVERVLKIQSGVMMNGREILLVGHGKIIVIFCLPIRRTIR